MATVDESRYKSNSYRSRAEAEKKEVQKVTKGQARVHQKTTGEKIKESFFGEGVDNISDHIIFDILLPSAKEIFDTVLTNTKDLILYGEIRDVPSADRRRTATRRGAYYNYSAPSTRRNSPAARRARFDFSYIEFDTPDDIDDVIREMREVWARDGEITVAQFYQSSVDPDEFKISPTDNNWGWIDIRAFTTADIRRVNSRNPDTGDIEIKWILDLPKPVPLD